MFKRMLLLLFLCTGLAKAEESPVEQLKDTINHLEFLIELDIENDASKSAEWQEAINEAIGLVLRCQHMGEEAFEEILEEFYQCIKRIGQLLKENQQVQGRLNVGFDAAE